MIIMNAWAGSLLVITALLALAIAGWQWRRAEAIEGASAFNKARIQLLEHENQRLSQWINKHDDEQRSRENALWREAIAERISRLRELEFLETVTYRELRRDELPALIESKIAEQYSDAELAKLSRVYAGIGLLPEGYDLKQAYIDLFVEQIAAFYDQHADALYLFEQTPLKNATNRMILAHELVHALQDQHFQLELLPLDLKENDDRLLAATALVEGDATWSMSLFFSEDAEPSGMVSALASGIFSQSVAALANSPTFLRESLLFPYTKGQEFATALYQSAGMDAISKAFSRLPNSTRQILHPSEYIASDPLFEPVEADWSTQTPEGSTELGRNVLGEFGISLLLRQWISSAKAEQAAKGWRGDGYRVTSWPDDSLGVELASWWDSPDEAREFALALAEAWTSRYALSGSWFQDNTLWQSDEGSARNIRISIDQSTVQLSDFPSIP